MRSSTEKISWVYPDTCNNCKKHRVQYKGKKVTPTTLTTYDVQKTIKAAEHEQIIFFDIFLNELN